VLVVIADPAYRTLVGQVLDGQDIAHLAVPRWRDAVAWLDQRPALAIVDLDVVPNHRANVAALLRSGWGEPVPFVALSGRADVGEVAVELGAVVGLRKPLNVGRLMAADTAHVVGQAEG